MACRVLEVTLVSAKDLKKVTVFSKMRVYAVASISGGDPRVPTHRTQADREGGRSPSKEKHAVINKLGKVVAESINHGLELATIVGNGEISLVKGVELN
uniref:Uncharacterized protein n=1 Tax=Oryza brachyantha TaxID=4533 RepID=J3M3Z8_ORYBR